MAAGIDPAENASGPAVEIPVFSGPLDLLLHLIRRNRVSIYDIPIAVICDQYHDHLRAMRDLDLDVAGEFVWMASWLLHLKSRTLLPARSGSEEEDPRQELVERLVAYRQVKELADFLYQRDVVRRCLWTPSVEVEVGEESTELDWEEVDLRVLARTYVEVMERLAAAHPPPLTVIPLRFSVRRVMSDLYHRVHSDGMVPLLRDLHRRPDSEEVVVLVVAALELVRLGGVRAEQRRPFAEVYLRPGSRTLDTDALEEERAHGA